MEEAVLKNYMLGWESEKIRDRFFARKIARAAVMDEGVFSSDQIEALLDMIDGLTGKDA